MKKISINNKEIIIVCACGGLPNHEHKEHDVWIIDCLCGCHEEGHDLDKEWFSDTHGKWFTYQEKNPLDYPL